MPELPEVETVKNSLHKHFLNSQVKGIDFMRDNLREPFDIPVIKRILVDQHVNSIRRRGKYLVLSTKAGHVISHLGMSGKILCLASKNPEYKHTHFVIEAVKSNQKVFLHYVDPRRFGRLDGWIDANLDNWQQHPWLQSLGPEPLDCQELAAVLQKAGGQSKRQIKSFIMDGQVVVGVGNIYACESLFATGIHPERKCHTLSTAEWKKLADVIQKILQQAIKLGGTSLRDYVDLDAKPGFFQISLSVYDRNKEPCKVCETPITSIKQSQRTTWFCPNCQKFSD